MINPVNGLLIFEENRNSAHVAHALQANCTRATEIKPVCNFFASVIRKICVEYNQKLGEVTVPCCMKLSAWAIYLLASSSVTTPKR